MPCFRQLFLFFAIGLLAVVFPSTSASANASADTSASPGPPGRVPDDHPARLKYGNLFNIKLQRYHDYDCTKKNKGLDWYQGDGTCYTPKGHHFSGYHIEWWPMDAYKAKHKVDDPMIVKPGKNRPRECQIRLWDGKKCHGNEIGQLDTANSWDNIRAACHQVPYPAGEARSFMIECDPKQKHFEYGQDPHPY